MNPDLQEMLAKSDQQLFKQGACHIFADELAKDLSVSGFTLSRIADCTSKRESRQALHIFLSKTHEMVDVDGIQDVHGYAKRIKSQFEQENVGLTRCFKVLPCSHAELFTVVPAPNDAERGVHNKWRLLIDPEFVSECRKRARNVIAKNPQLYGLL